MTFKTPPTRTLLIVGAQLCQTLGAPIIVVFSFIVPAYKLLLLGLALFLVLLEFVLLHRVNILDGYKIPLYYYGLPAILIWLSIYLFIFTIFSYIENTISNNLIRMSIALGAFLLFGLAWHVSEQLRENKSRWKI